MQYFITICVFVHCSSGNKCVQLWVQVLEETDGDYHPVLVEDESLVDTGGMFVLTKVCVCYVPTCVCMHVVHVTLKTKNLQHCYLLCFVKIQTRLSRTELTFSIYIYTYYATYCIAHLYREKRSSCQFKSFHNLRGYIVSVSPQ